MYLFMKQTKHGSFFEREGKNSFCCAHMIYYSVSILLVLHRFSVVSPVDRRLFFQTKNVWAICKTAHIFRSNYMFVSDFLILHVCTCFQSSSCKTSPVLLQSCLWTEGVWVGIRRGRLVPKAKKFGCLVVCLTRCREGFSDTN